MNNKPLISIITPSLNRADFIEEAVQSVINQDYPFVEHIIVDGGSSDVTLEILENYPRLRVVSELDEGIYDALNKGIVLAQGDILGFLNSDDYYEPYVFSEIINIFKKNPNIDAVVGGIDIQEKDPNDNWKTLLTFPTISHQNLWYRLTIGSPNTFTPESLVSFDDWVTEHECLVLSESIY
jgi:glycosyltransferase involved in cell wall biosynthesis